MADDYEYDRYYYGRLIEIPAVKNLFDSRGHRFGYHGVEIAWTREDALKLLDELANTDIEVLGGDVYGVIGDKNIPIGDWHCERNGHETPSDFATRSQRLAAHSVRAYPEQGPTLYVLVFGPSDSNDS